MLVTLENDSPKPAYHHAGLSRTMATATQTIASGSCPRKRTALTPGATEVVSLLQPPLFKRAPGDGAIRVEVDGRDEGSLSPRPGMQIITAVLPILSAAATRLSDRFPSAAAWTTMRWRICSSRRAGRFPPPRPPVRPMPAPGAAVTIRIAGCQTRGATGAPTGWNWITRRRKS